MAIETKGSRKGDAELGKIEELKNLLNEAEDKIRYQCKTFDALLSISQSLGESPTIDDVFTQAIQPIQEITGYATIALRLYDKQQNQFVLRAQKGFSPLMLEILSKLPRAVDETYFSQMLATKKAVIRDVLITESPAFRNVVFFPLLANDQIVGSMDLGSAKERTWTDDEISWLELVGKYMGMIIHQIQITEKLESLSALQEREYIAQELHDDTVQLISALILWAQESEMDFDEGDLSAAQKAVQKIEQGANLAYKSLREEIFGLRKKVESDENILLVIKKSLDRFEDYWGIRVNFRLESNLWSQSPLKLPLRTEIQLLRIIQEALTNVRKHAKATSIEVVVQITEEWLKVNILDNGQGFNPEIISSDHLGLRIMRERASSLSGTIQITSRIGCGSNIEIALPR
jgi:two-component system, NarL family, nitrate/nitrite sensor histidine kinase NarX